MTEESDMKTVIKVNGMSCNHCKMSVEMLLPPWRVFRSKGKPEKRRTEPEMDEEKIEELRSAIKAADSIRNKHSPPAGD